MRLTGMDAAAVVSNQTSGLQGVSNNDFPGLHKIKIVENNTSQQGSTDEYRDIPVSESTVSNAVDKMNKMFEGTNRRFEFSVHDRIPGIMIKIVDSTTGEVIREVPPKKILDMVANMMEMAGLLVDERR